MEKQRKCAERRRHDECPLPEVQIEKRQAIGSIVLALLFVKDSRREKDAPSLDLLGGVLATAALGTVSWGLTIGSGRNGRTTEAIAMVSASIVLMLGFLFVEKIRGENAMMPLSLFGSRRFIGLTLLTLLLYGALGALLVLFPFVLIQAAGYSATQAGTSLLPFAVVLALTYGVFFGYAGHRPDEMQLRSQIRFTGFVCAQGYDLVPITRGPGMGYGDARLLMAHGKKVPPEWLSNLVPKGPEDFRVEPLDHDVGVFRHFADLPYDPRAYQAFCGKWGLLDPVRVISGVSWPPDTKRKGKSGLNEPLELRTDDKTVAVSKPHSNVLPIAAFHSVVRLALGLSVDAEPPWVRMFRKERTYRAAHSAKAQLAALIKDGLKTQLETDPETGRPVLVLRPSNLKVAIALQTVKSLSGVDEQDGVKLFQCQQCQKYFNVGPGTGRRSRSKFCSRKCQDRHTYQIRKLRRGRRSGPSRLEPT